MKKNTARVIPYGKQNINQDDINSVISVLKSDFITQGPEIENFENKLTNYTKAKYCTAVNSATSALHISCLALGLTKNDIAWTSPNSFVASSNCALYCGAKIDFVDIDEKTYNICPVLLEEKLKIAKKQRKLPKIVIVVHFSGQSCDMEKIKALSDEYGFKIIEDASHAVGGSYLNHKIGSCKFSDITVFSFHPVKVITTAEGGVALTNNKEIDHKLNLLRSHGNTRDKKQMGNKKDAWYYEQIDLGFNYRMTDIQAALGSSQLKRLDLFIKKRHQIAQKYNQLLKNLPINLPFQNSNQYSSFHLYVIALHNQNLRKKLFNHLRQNKILVNVHYIPIHTQPFYQKLGFKKGDFPNAEDYYERTMSLPMFYDFTVEEQNYVVKIMNVFFDKNN